MTGGKRPRIPHPLVLLTGCVLLAAAASYVLQAGEFDRRTDEVTGRSVVVAGTYHEVERSPVGLFDAMIALPVGMAERADVIFLIFMFGGAFTVIDQTGTLRRAVGTLVRALRGRDLLVIPVISVFFALGGITINMSEEIVAIVPVLLILTTLLGFSPLVAVSMSAGAAAVGAAFSPINPFGVLIAQGVADVRPGSGWAFRTVVLVAALTLWIGMTVRYARKSRTRPNQEVGAEPDASLSARDLAILGILATTFAIAVWGLLVLDWDFNRLSASFFVMGVIAGLVAGLGFGGTADAYVRGFRDMSYAALLIGFAGAITVVLEQGRVIDTVVHGIFVPLEGLPKLVSALGMMAAQAVIHVPVPSNSGQAVLTMPVLVPLSDLLELPRQVTILAYQYGGMLCDLLTPTNGGLMAVLAAAGVRYDDWLGYAAPLFGALLTLGAVAIAVGIAVGLA
jgi:uncharacterized ion transporter superfamily protein YfcC